GGAEDVDAQVVLVDLDVGVLSRVRVDEHTGRGGVDAPLRLGDRHPLHAVHPALELQGRPYAVGGRFARAHGLREGLVATGGGRHRVDGLGDPAAPLGVAQVHAGE